MIPTLFLCASHQNALTRLARCIHSEAFVLGDNAVVAHVHWLRRGEAEMLKPERIELTENLESIGEKC